MAKFQADFNPTEFDKIIFYKLNEEILDSPELANDGVMQKESIRNISKKRITIIDFLRAWTFLWLNPLHPKYDGNTKRVISLLSRTDYLYTKFWEISFDLVMENMRKYAEQRLFASINIFNEYYSKEQEVLRDCIKRLQLLYKTIDNRNSLLKKIAMFKEDFIALSKESSQSGLEEITLFLYNHSHKAKLIEKTIFNKLSAKSLKLSSYFQKAYSLNYVATIESDQIDALLRNDILDEYKQKMTIPDNKKAYKKNIRKHFNIVSEMPFYVDGKGHIPISSYVGHATCAYILLDTIKESKFIKNDFDNIIMKYNLSKRFINTLEFVLFSKKKAQTCKTVAYNLLNITKNDMANNLSISNSDSIIRSALKQAAKYKYHKPLEHISDIAKDIVVRDSILNIAYLFGRQKDIPSLINPQSYS